MTHVVEILKTHPQIIIFLAIAFGYLVGRIKIFNFNLGSTAGVLLVSLFLGQIGITMPQVLEAIMFSFFMFCIGYKVGPEFFNGLKKEGVKYIWLSFFVAAVGLIVAYMLAKLFNFDPGTAAGMLGGAMTQSSIIGTAGEAIKNLNIDAATKSLIAPNVAIAYAITYIFGTAGLVVFFKLVPRLMGMDLKLESKKLEREMSGGGDDEDDDQSDLFLWNKQVDLRVYLVENTDIDGETVAEIESLFPTRFIIDEIKRNGKVIDSSATEIVKNGDLITALAEPGRFISAQKIIGSEVYDKDLEHLTGESLKICVLNKDVVGKTLGELSKKYGRGCFLKSISRAGHNLPIAKNVVIKKCDELYIVGAKKDVERLVKHVGYPERTSSASDLVLVGVGCALGALFGMLAVNVGGIQVTLGAGGGVLFGGLICGWLRSRHPTFGLIPAGAQWILTDLGLNLFIACVGIMAGPKALEALKTTGPSLFFAGIILTLAPMILGLIFGKYVLKMNPVLLFGALTGAGTVTAALNGLKEEAGSSIPTLGYTLPFAFGNVLLTICGVVMVHLV